MGEGGCSPDYFLHKMTVDEADSYLKGQDRRSRQGWEQTRLLCGLICKVLTGDDLGLTFPWDESGEADITTPEELARLREMARRAEAAANAKGNP